VKTPLPTLALVLLGLGAIARRRRWDDLWLVLPPVLLLYVLSFHYGKNYGVRYLLPALPFVILAAGDRGRKGCGAGRARGSSWRRSCCVSRQLRAGGAAPSRLLQRARRSTDHARRLLLDSNLDWGQDLGRLKAYLDANGTSQVSLGYFGHVDPKLYGIDYTLPPQEPTPGRHAVSANFLAGYPYAITYAGARMIGCGAGRGRGWIG